MKTAIQYRTNTNRPFVPYRNAAERRELVNKFLDMLLTAAVGAGAAAIILFMSVLA